MSIEKYFALAQEPSEKCGPCVHVVDMTRDFFPGCMCMDACWYVEPYEKKEYMKHDSDELMILIGGDVDNPEELGAEVEIYIENDKLTLTKTCFVFVPKGAAHGIMAVKNVKKPFFRFSVMLNSDTYEEIPAAPTEPAGKYANHWVEKYAPVDGKLPTAPEGFLTLLLWIDGKKLKGAPYTEAVWFKTTNDTGPEAHSHEFDEFIGFFGTDPEHPDELGGEVAFFIEDKKFSFTKSCLVYIPRGVEHSPILVPKMDRPLLHFSGGNGGDYVREGSDQF